jgi:hypothetical protein
MSTRSSSRLRALALAAATLAATVPGVAAEERAAAPTEDPAIEDPSPREECCFSNRAYVGVCVVTPAEDETCATILAYLNNPRSRGKDYCGKTTIRGGWQQTACEVPQVGGPTESIGR